ncbi:MAG: hypothetical protein Q8L38_03855, partial [Pseudohongiella sp.]|nr:hypothetical protein [Pseudohongiella sp.]
MTHFPKQLALAAAISLLLACGAESPAPGQTAATPQTSMPAIATADMLACADALAPLIPNTGVFSRDIGATYPEAQAFFDQGMRLSYGYYFP